MFIAEKGIDIPVVEVDLANREQHSEAFRQINPYRTVPVLQLADGTSLTSSAGIIQYLEHRWPDPPLLGKTAVQRGEVADLDWRIEQQGFAAVGEAFRNRAKSFAKNALTGETEYAQIPQLAERGNLRTAEFFDWLDQLLQNKAFVAGEDFTVADITAFVTVDFAKWIKQQPGEQHGHLNFWYRAISERHSASL